MDEAGAQRGSFKSERDKRMDWYFSKSGLPFHHSRQRYRGLGARRVLHEKLLASAVTSYGKGLSPESPRAEAVNNSCGVSGCKTRSAVRSVTAINLLSSVVR